MNKSFRLFVRCSPAESYTEFTSSVVSADDLVIQYSTPKGSGFGYEGNSNFNDIEMDSTFYKWLITKLTKPDGTIKYCLDAPLEVKVNSCCDFEQEFVTFGNSVDFCHAECKVNLTIIDCSKERSCYNLLRYTSIETAATYIPNKEKWLRYCHGTDGSSALWSILWILFLGLSGGPFGSLNDEALRNRIAGCSRLTQIFYLRDILAGAAAICGLKFSSDLFNNSNNIMNKVGLFCPHAKGTQGCAINSLNFGDFSVVELLEKLETMNVGWKIIGDTLYVDRKDKIRLLGQTFLNIDEIEPIGESLCYEYDQDANVSSVIIKWKADEEKGNESLPGQYNSNYFETRKFEQRKDIEIPFGGGGFHNDRENEPNNNPNDPRSLRPDGTIILTNQRSACCKLIYIDRCKSFADGSQEAFTSCKVARPVTIATGSIVSAIGYHAVYNSELFTTPHIDENGDLCPSIHQELFETEYDGSKKFRIDSVSFKATCGQMKLLKENGTSMVVESKYYGKGYYTDASVDYDTNTVTLENICFEVV